MVVAVLGAEPIKDPSIGDWEGGCVFLEGNGALPVPCVGCGLTWVWGGGAVNAKWQGLISFAKMLPLNVDVQL